MMCKTQGFIIWVFVRFLWLFTTVSWSLCPLFVYVFPCTASAAAAYSRFCFLSFLWAIVTVVSVLLLCLTPQCANGRTRIPALAFGGKKNVRPVDCCGFGCVDWLICRQQFEGRRSSRRRWHFNVWIRSEIADAEDHDRSISLWWPCCTWLLRFYLRPMVTGVTFLFSAEEIDKNWFR